VPFWHRRRETLNEQLMREAGLDGAEIAAPAAAREPERAPELRPFVEWPASGPHLLDDRDTRGLPRVDDAVVTLEQAGIEGDLAVFVALPDGTLLLEELVGDGDMSALAEAVEQQLAPPYRARARRQEGDLWAVGATRVEVRELPGLPGDAIALTVVGGERTLTVDGVPHVELPALAPLVAEHADVALQAERLDGDWWEVRAGPL
jgi:hypothetical protein